MKTSALGWRRAASSTLHTGSKHKLSLSHTFKCLTTHVTHQQRLEDPMQPQHRTALSQHRAHMNFQTCKYQRSWFARKDHDESPCASKPSRWLETGQPCGTYTQMSNTLPNRRDKWKKVIEGNKCRMLTHVPYTGMAISVLPKNSFWKPPVEPGTTTHATEGVSRPAGGAYMVQSCERLIAISVLSVCCAWPNGGRLAVLLVTCCWVSVQSLGTEGRPYAGLRRASTAEARIQQAWH